MTVTKGKTAGILLGAQAIFVVLFGIFLELGDQAGPQSHKNETNHSIPQKQSILDGVYPMYMDVHVMMLVGFGFLMQFLKKYGFSSLGFTFLLLSYVIQWSLLVNGWFESIVTQSSKVFINVQSLLHADFAAATILISFGGILGVSSPIQIVIMATLEVVFFNISLFIGVEILGTLDVGGTIFVHTFGAYFGLSVARVLYKKNQTISEKECSNYNSDIRAMIGTTFLWVFWPSFNSSAAFGIERHRAVVNTVLSLCSCTVVTIAISTLTNKKGKLNMVHIQNATLSGGVMVGCCADIIINPFVSLLIGCVSAVITTLGFQYIQPFLMKKIKLHDSCGIHYLHGIPGILGGVISIIVIATAHEDAYMKTYDDIFGQTSDSRFRIYLSQPLTQGVALLTTLGIAVLSGSLTGFLLKLPIWDNLNSEELYEDDALWLTEETTTEETFNGIYENTKVENEEKL